jgi:hypothetical protein
MFGLGFGELILVLVIVLIVLVLESPPLVRTLVAEFETSARVSRFGRDRHHSQRAG